MNKELISDCLQDIVCSSKFIDLTTKEKLTLCANIILLVIQDYLPDDLLKDKTSVLNNGKEISLLIFKYKYNPTLQIAFKTHLILDLATNYND